MSDRACNYCNDRGDCSRCSYWFQPEKIHTACGHKWKEHEVKSGGPSGYYPPFAVCPPKEQ